MGKVKGTVKFWDLGRNDAKGSFKVDANSEAGFNTQLYKEFRKHLISAYFDFSNGFINVGFHTVGKYKFKED